MIYKIKLLENKTKDIIYVFFREEVVMRWKNERGQRNGFRKVFTILEIKNPETGETYAY